MKKMIRNLAALMAIVMTPMFMLSCSNKNSEPDGPVTKKDTTYTTMYFYGFALDSMRWKSTIGGFESGLTEEQKAEVTAQAFKWVDAYFDSIKSSDKSIVLTKVSGHMPDSVYDAEVSTTIINYMYKVFDSEAPTGMPATFFATSDTVDLSVNKIQTGLRNYLVANYPEHSAEVTNAMYAVSSHLKELTYTVRYIDGVFDRAGYTHKNKLSSPIVIKAQTTTE